MCQEIVHNLEALLPAADPLPNDESEFLLVSKSVPGTVPASRFHLPVES